MSVPQYLILAAILPLVGFFLLIFLGKKLGRLSGPLATLLVFGSLALSTAATINWIAKPEYNAAHYVETLSFRWIPLPSVEARPATTMPAAASRSAGVDAMPASPGPAIAVGVVVDSLTIAMFTMITLIASLVHLFSIAYMGRDPHYPRFFAFLGLFCFAMLALVLSNSLIQLFMFWELVGICSFLLIGFWNHNRGPAMASVKAAIINRIGDAFFLVGIGLFALHVGVSNLSLYEASGTPTLAAAVAAASQSELLNTQPQSILEDFSRLSVASDSTAFLLQNFGPSFLHLSWLTWAGICLFAGAAAKSAQFPFHVWLPDAMEGPTPVLALIHAATMVAAGVFLVARVYPLLTMDARLVVAVIGCLTLAIGALIAGVQTDLKKILAYSTLSQLGFMMLFLGAGGYVAGLLHLFTHAFFKACLFLAAGSVLHSLQHTADLRRMGGLWKRLPITAACALIAALSLAATPWFSGALSRDMGMAGVYEFAHRLSVGGGRQARYAMALFWIPTAASYLTAFYIGRFWWLTFGGKSRDEDLAEHAHENALMTLPLILLASLSVAIWFGGFFGVPSLIGKSLPPGVPVVPAAEDSQNLIFRYLGYAFAAALLAPLFYLRGFALADRVRRWPVFNLLYAWLSEKMFFDDLYNGILVTLTLVSARVLAFFDRYLLDSLVDAVAYLARGLGRVVNLLDVRIVDALMNAAADAAVATGQTVLAPQSGRIRTSMLVMFSVLALAAATLVLLLLVH